MGLRGFFSYTAGQVHGSGVSAFRLNRLVNGFRGPLESGFVSGSCGLLSVIASVDDVGTDHRLGVLQAG